MKKSISDLRQREKSGLFRIFYLAHKMHVKELFWLAQLQCSGRGAIG